MIGNNEILKKLGTRFSYFIIVLAIFLLIAEFVFHRHGETSIEDIIFFPAIFGFLAFIFIVFAGILLRMFVMKKEDYYDK